MHNLGLLTLLLSSSSFVFSYPKYKWDLNEVHKRIRRWETTDLSGDFNAPIASYPLSGNHEEDLEPLFPMTHTFHNGLNINDNSDYAIYGHLKVPIPNWGIWDLHGHMFPQGSSPEVQYGHLLNPVNTLNLSQDEIKRLHHDPTIKNNEQYQNPRTVSNLPGIEDYLGYGGRSYTPLVCRPPVCNPHVQTVAVGTQFQQGKDFQIPSKLDFPILGNSPTKPSYRWTLKSDPTFGVQPIGVQYGHALTGMNPWTSVFRKMPNQGNPFVVDRVANPTELNKVPFVAPAIMPHNLFEDD